MSAYLASFRIYLLRVFIKLIDGNHDHGGYGTKVYQTLMASAGFRVLRNDLLKLELIDGSVIEIASLDDLMLGRPDYEGILSKLSKKAFSILLVHEPDAALTANQYPVNLQISGHTHGGQIQIPVFGPLITPPYGEIYTEGNTPCKNSFENLLFIFDTYKRVVDDESESF